MGRRSIDTRSLLEWCVFVLVALLQLALLSFAIGMLVISWPLPGGLSFFLTAMTLIGTCLTAAIMGDAARSLIREGSEET